MFSRTAKSLPIVTYHYVTNDTVELTTPPARFEEHCRILAENGWRGVGLDEAEAFLLHGEPLPPKSVLLTLDDGYLDNYVYAWPILRKYGHKGVIFPIAGLVTEAQKAAEQQGAGLRPTIEDVWAGRVQAQNLPPVDAIQHASCLGHTVVKDLFFTWDEARAMEKSGVIAIAGHGMLHEAVFASPVYTGFSQPEACLISFDYPVRGDFWGRPLFEKAAQLTGKAFIPNEDMLEALRAAVPQDEAGAAAFFKDEAHIAQLREILDSFGDALGRFESDEEQKTRITQAMADTQAVLTKELGHAVQSFCWPWGVHSPLAVEAGQSAGFSVFYTTRKGPNPPGKPLAVRRLDCRQNPKVLLSRIKIHARPIWGLLYEDHIRKWKISKKKWR